MRIFLCHAKVLPGRTPGYRAAFRPDSSREIQNRPSGRPSAGREADFEVSSDQNPAAARKSDFRRGGIIA